MKSFYSCIERVATAFIAALLVELLKRLFL